LAASCAQLSNVCAGARSTLAVAALVCPPFANRTASPQHSPKANAKCERMIGTIRRYCLDWLISISKAHLRSILKSWVEHYNCYRPHSGLGPWHIESVERFGEF
jgi:integrase-like protein